MLIRPVKISNNQTAVTIELRTYEDPEHTDVGNNVVYLDFPKGSNYYRGVLKIAGGYNRGNYSGVTIYSILGGDYRSVAILSTAFSNQNYANLSVVPLRECIKITLLGKAQHATLNVVFERMDNGDNGNQRSFIGYRYEHVDNIQIDNISVLSLKPGYKYYSSDYESEFNVQLISGEKKTKGYNHTLTLNSLPDFKFKRYKSKLVA